MLKKTIIIEILSNKKLLIALMDYFEIVEIGYLRRLLRKNDPRFTQVEVLQIISTYLKKEVDEIICTPKARRHEHV